MMLSHEVLLREAAASGFQAEPLEKAARLLELLDTIRRHPFLKGRLVLKGGTALNLFLFDVPRLSVDVDLNYIGGPDRETMLAERPQVEQSQRESAPGRTPPRHPLRGAGRATQGAELAVPPHRLPR